VRRQDTWFRRDPRVVWLEVTEDDRPVDVGRLADRVASIAFGISPI
jgi:tRNA A37 N6-isopentenylltransferase MiaA